ncbi:MAG: chloride channel protein [Methylococcaceae bacterium]
MRPRSLFTHPTWLHRLVFWLGAITVGLVIVAMTLFSEWAGDVYRHFSWQYPWFDFIVPPLGLCFTAWLTLRFFPGSERSGIPQVKTALEIGNTSEHRLKLISLRIAIGKMLLPILGLLSGASVGFGGPAVHVGASIMLSLGRAFNFPAHYLERGLILAGSAAGFAALFSTPLAGIIFALEELGRTLEEHISSQVLTAIILSGITAYALLNRYIYLEDESLLLPWGRAWLAVPLCGICGGLLGGLFSKICILGNHAIKQVRLSPLVVALFCGGLIALINYFSHGSTAGTGYQQTKTILHGTEAMDFNFPFLKMAAICATFFSGIPSGIFVPSLAVGAGFGVDLGQQFPIAPLSVMVFLTMAAYFSGTLQLPLTAFVITMEMTNNHGILIPLMATSFLASSTSKLINPTPLYLSLCSAYQTYSPNLTANKTDQAQDPVK